MPYVVKSKHGYLDNTLEWTEDLQEAEVHTLKEDAKKLLINIGERVQPVKIVEDE